MITADFLHSIMIGDEDAIQTLIRAHQRQVFQLALSILDTSKTDQTAAAAQAELATRETFMSAVDKISRYREDANFNVWLYRIAIETSLRRYQRWKFIRFFQKTWWKITRQPDEEALNKLIEVPKPSENQAAGVAAANDEALWNAVRGLNDRLRLPVILRYYHDFSISEIAGMLRISEGAVHARLDQARDKLAGK